MYSASTLHDFGAGDIIQNMLCPNSVIYKTSSPKISHSDLVILGMDVFVICIMCHRRPCFLCSYNIRCALTCQKPLVQSFHNLKFTFCQKWIWHHKSFEILKCVLQFNYFCKLLLDIWLWRTFFFFSKFIYSVISGSLSQFPVRLNSMTVLFSNLNDQVVHHPLLDVFQ